jgi:hypothetical protein
MNKSFIQVLAISSVTLKLVITRLVFIDKKRKTTAVNKQSQKKQQRKAKEYDSEEVQGEELETKLDQLEMQSQEDAQDEEDFIPKDEDVTITGFKTCPVADLNPIFANNSRISSVTTGCYIMIRYGQTKEICVPKKACSHIQ